MIYATSSFNLSQYNMMTNFHFDESERLENQTQKRINTLFYIKTECEFSRLEWYVINKKEE